MLANKCLILRLYGIAYELGIKINQEGKGLITQQITAVEEKYAIKVFNC